MAVYGKAVELVAVVEGLIAVVPKVQGALAEQVRRAVSSVVLNIAEGASEFSRREKLRFYRIARRSVAETRAGFDVLLAVGAVQPERLNRFDRLADEVSRMLHALVSRPPSPSPRTHPHPHLHPHPPEL